MLEAREITRRAADGTVLLEGVSLRVAPGERWAVTGPTGSGKTVFLRALALLDPIDGGEILWEGRSVADADVPAFRRRVVYLHQRPVLVEGTVETNLRLPLAFRANREREFDAERAIRLLEDVGRDASFLQKPAGELSGGEGQLTAFLRAMLLEPSVLLLDEPTAALDAPAAQLLERLLDRWLHEAADDRAIVWVSHDRRQVERVAEKILPLEAGRASLLPHG